MHLNILSKLKTINIRVLVFSIVLSIIVGIIIVIGTELDILTNINWDISTLLYILLMIIIFIPVNYLLIYYLTKIQIKTEKKQIKHTYLISFAIIFVFGFMVFLAMYPGMYGYDGIYQISQVQNNKVNTHYSVLFVYYLTSFTHIAELFGRGHEFAIGLYTFIQLLLMTSISSYVCYYVYKKTSSKIVWIISLLLYSVIMPYKLMVVSTSQDVLFAGFITLLLIKAIDFCIDDNYTKLKRNWFITPLLVLIICLFRNNGLYAILFMALVMLIFNYKKWFYTLTVIAIPIVLYFVITGPFYSNVLKINTKQNDSIKEMSSVFGQQLIRAYSENKEELSKEEIDKLYKFYQYDIEELTRIYNYRACIADDVKKVLNTELVKNSKMDYISFWLSIGIKSPRAYIEAFGLTNLGLWYPFKYYPDERMYHPYEEYRSRDINYHVSEKYYTIHNYSKFPILDKYIKWYINDYGWQKIPVLRIINSMGFYFIATLFVIAIILFNKKYKLLIPMGLITGYYITLFLAPVAIYRYVFPIVVAMPLYLYIVLYSNKKRS